MKPELLSQTESVARGVALARVQVFPHHPAPLSAAIASFLPQKNGPDVMEMESQGAALSAAMGCALAGRRTFLSASVPHALQELFLISHHRLPVVMANVSRVPGVHSVFSSQNDVLAMRDMGWIMFFAGTNQEARDFVIQAHRVCEDQRVSLPAVVNIDGVPSFREPVPGVSDQVGATFLSKPRPRIDPKKDAAVREGGYPATRMLQQKSMKAALKVIAETGEAWKKRCRSVPGLIESYCLDDADVAFVVAGWHSGTVRAAVDALRLRGVKAGMLRIRVFRPFPAEAIASALHAQRVWVIDQGVSLGASGIFFTEIRNLVPCRSCIALRPLREKDIHDLVNQKEERVWLP